MRQLLLLGSLLAAALPAAAQPGRAPIFREVEFVHGSVALGAALDRRAVPGATTVADTLVRLAPRTFADAEFVTLHLDPRTRVVRAMHFTYAPGTDFEAQVADYARALGPPARREQAGRAPGPVVRSAAWEDAATRFVYAAAEQEGTRLVYSVLADRRLTGR